jgi:hypothetical protein
VAQVPPEHKTFDSRRSVKNLLSGVQDPLLGTHQPPKAGEATAAQLHLDELEERRAAGDKTLPCVHAQHA